MNGSLGRDRNTPSEHAERPSACAMTDGDGKADEFKTFVTMESPRGVIWDGLSGTAPGALRCIRQSSPPSTMTTATV